MVALRRTTGRVTMKTQSAWKTKKAPKAVKEPCVVGVGVVVGVSMLVVGLVGDWLDT